MAGINFCGTNNWSIQTKVFMNVNNTRVTDYVIKRDKAEYYSHALDEVMDEENRNYWILVTISSYIF